MFERQVPFMFKPIDAAKILSISRSKVYVLLKSGKLDSVQIGRSRRISQEHLTNFIKRLEG
jgi:excisionase family DNA binding protein